MTDGNALQPRIATVEGLARLTASDRALLRITWAILSAGKKELATKIFRMIFEQSPEAKVLFKFETNTPAEIATSSEFQFHALRFIEVIESAVERLDAASSLQPLLLNLGQVHAKLAEARGFDTHYWAVFIECTVFVFRRRLRDVAELAEQLDDAIVLWRALLRAVVAGMRDGFEHAQSQRARNRAEARGSATRAVLARAATAPEVQPPSTRAVWKKATNGEKRKSSSSSAVSAATLIMEHHSSYL